LKELKHSRYPHPRLPASLHGASQRAQLNCGSYHFSIQSAFEADCDDRRFANISRELHAVYLELQARVLTDCIFTVLRTDRGLQQKLRALELYKLHKTAHNGRKLAGGSVQKRKATTLIPDSDKWACRAAGRPTETCTTATLNESLGFGKL